ncbi:hypothetical protein OsI_06358 [Oryza sativa Indica Group]|uniref:Uncharacterized protein n=1 Tax=Oryza sativa subsp. indica TaxID=39946 RepID=A2X2D6_ORYSI|nr:hypothetical protein OsI_06358 [Oryza sativa Indica Group]
MAGQCGEAAPPRPDLAIPRPDVALRREAAGGRRRCFGRGAIGPGVQRWWLGSWERWQRGSPGVADAAWQLGAAAAAARARQPWLGVACPERQPRTLWPCAPGTGASAGCARSQSSSSVTGVGARPNGSVKGASGGGLSSTLPVGTLALPGAHPLLCWEFLGWIEAAACQQGKFRLPKQCHLVPGSPSAKLARRAAGVNGGCWASS